MILVPLRPENRRIRPAAAAVKAPDELAALGLDRGPRRPTDSTIRAKGSSEWPGPATGHNQPERRLHKIADSTQEVNSQQIKELRDAQREAQQHTDERLNALITIVDGMIRKPPPN